ncbi:MAG: SDR family NAD(P)-dependent oxidoreductase, partial [Acidimicrobiaceae bacterium]|nr:SDR family NAD(P)-dependent oxidoreductase [Acidimicrobiaceae bacterium]
MTGPAPSPGRLRGRSVLVTGGGTGIGRACAARLAAEGAAVTICGRTEQRLAAAAAGISCGDGGSVAYEVADVTSEDDMSRVAEAACDTDGHLHGVV